MPAGGKEAPHEFGDLIIEERVHSAEHTEKHHPVDRDIEAIDRV